MSSERYGVFGTKNQVSLMDNPPNVFDMGDLSQVDNIHKIKKSIKS